ncbi:hypothetical protein [Nocardia sp. NPDC052566]|uniref:hypothetical protein n=1 Tax=Nocardia sp. NPDC052566 TaxID=3364330 RepID=UPI0037C85DFB
MSTRLARHAALTLAITATGLGLGFAALTGTPHATAQGYIPCEQWQAMHPGWPCIDTPQPPPGGPPTVSTPPPLPTQAPNLPEQPGNGGGIGAGALAPPPIAPGNGTPIVPVPGAETPGLPGNQPPTAPVPGTVAPQSIPAAPPQPTEAPSLAPQAADTPTPVPPVPTRTVPTPSTPTESKDHSTAAEPGDGPDRRIPLLLLAGAAAFIAPAFRSRGGTSSQQLTITKPWDGGEQTFILMTDPSAPREYRFPQEVPPGGQLRKNPDGSVDVLDADGTVMSHTNPPWAYDALGRPVRTHYEVDGDTIVQHIEPDENNVFPILADPDTVPQCSISSDSKGGTTTTSTHADGSVFTTYEDSRGSVTTALSTPVPNSGGTVDTRINNADGTTTDMRSVPNGQGGVTTWTANPDGSNSVAYPPSAEHPNGLIVKDPAPGSSTPAETVELGPGGQSGHVTEYNTDGTISQADFRPSVLGPVTDITNPDGSHTQVNTVGGNTNGRPGSIITQDDGSRYVLQPDGTAIPIDRYNNAIGTTNYNNQYDPVTGTWHSDPVTHRDPIITAPDGTSTQKWFFRGNDGEELFATAYFDKNGNLLAVNYTDYTGVQTTTFTTIDGITLPTGTTKADAGNVIDNADLVFNAVMAVTGVAELGYTAGRLVGTQLLSRGLLESGTTALGAETLTSQLGTAGTALGGRGPSGIVALNPSTVRFSQNKVNDAAEIIESMARSGWVGDPIDVVVASDGGLTAVDNTRVLAAKYTDTPILARIHAFDEPIPESMAVRFTRQGDLPQTWGEAMENRIANQSTRFRNTYPEGSPLTGWTGN